MPPVRVGFRKISSWHLRACGAFEEMMAAGATAKRNVRMGVLTNMSKKKLRNRRQKKLNKKLQVENQKSPDFVASEVVVDAAVETFCLDDELLMTAEEEEEDWVFTPELFFCVDFLPFAQWQHQQHQQQQQSNPMAEPHQQRLFTLRPLASFTSADHQRYGMEVLLMDGQSFYLSKRYSDFTQLSAQLRQQNYEVQWQLPSKLSVFFSSDWQQQRVDGLAKCLESLLTQPLATRLPLVRQFLELDTFAAKLQEQQHMNI